MEKKAIYIDGEQKPLNISVNLWEYFDVAIKNDKMQRFTNKSEAIRHFIIRFIAEVEEQE